MDMAKFTVHLLQFPQTVVPGIFSCIVEFCPSKIGAATLHMLRKSVMSANKFFFSLVAL